MTDQASRAALAAAITAVGPDLPAETRITLEDALESVIILLAHRGDPDLIAPALRDAIGDLAALAAAQALERTARIPALERDVARLRVEFAAHTTTAAPPPAVPPGRARLLAPAEFATRGVLPDAEALAWVRPVPERRPANATANATYPTDAQLAAYRERDIWQAGLSAVHAAEWKRRQLLVSGRPGRALTTDELIQWAAHKWGLDEDMLRAQVAQESWWRQNTAGDYRADATIAPPGAVTKIENGETLYALSYGVGQLKYGPQGTGGWPAPRDSTAFNLDHLACIERNTMDGLLSWMPRKSPSPPAGWPRYGDLAADPVQRFWATMGAHYFGDWCGPEALSYIAKVQGHLTARAWERPDF